MANSNGRSNKVAACWDKVMARTPHPSPTAGDMLFRQGGGLLSGVRRHATAGWCRIRAKLACERGQGTTEYAILVGVLVVIAILAITVFRPRLQELWDAISDGINSL